ncbi:DedA family protein [Bradyrhizobium sp. CCBAU 51765]|uniref:DedA family protein n=1 Tax=Bradyrhizobium sp. CCBAU 51765 TaxID=1325102 RepID=UPI00188788D6|nr:DedA family protein [Bradyrhizobium sp. CCBAU 51765]QOZ06695.1 DedA family protein [Bradyrhizobium sp. CCBAU 51765]
MSDWIVTFLSEAGYLGIFALMVLENVFPPIPSELIMTFAGFAASQGRLNLAAVICAGTFGSTLGTTFWYLAARCLGLQRVRELAGRYGRLLAVSAADIDHAVRWFGRHGRSAILLGRLVPTVRTLISVPAGLLSMPFALFLAYTMAGTLIWVTFLACAGYWLGENYSTVGRFIDPIASLIVAGAATIYALRLLRRHSRRDLAE